MSDQLSQSGGSPMDDEQFAKDFTEAQRCLREDDMEGLIALASRSSAKRAVEAARRAREKGGDDE